MPYWYELLFLTSWKWMNIIECESYIWEQMKNHTYDPHIKFWWYLECYKKEVLNEIIGKIHYFLNKNNGMIYKTT